MKPLPRASRQLALSSPAFRSGGRLPAAFTCDGAGRPPPLRFSGVPKGARELALVVTDPNAPGGTFVHWTLWGLRPRAAGTLPTRGTQGRNSFGKLGWAPPCPPGGAGPHHYVFTLYALRAPLGASSGAAPGEVTSALARNVLASGGLIGIYARKK